MKKIKIGAIGKDAFCSALYLTEQFNTCELYSVFETNKHRLNETIQLAIEKGSYIKAFTNSDDFYSSGPDIILIDENMKEYIFSDNSCLIGGFCEEKTATDGIAAIKENALYFYNSDTWNLFDEASLSSEDKLLYIKSNKNPLIAFYLFKQGGVWYG